jgi:hypothetical protein
MTSFHHFSKDNVNSYPQISFHGINQTQAHPLSSGLINTNTNLNKTSNKFLTVPSPIKNYNLSSANIIKNHNDENIFNPRNPNSPLRTPERLSREQSLISPINLSPKIKKKCNSTRTNLLLLVNKEFTENKKISKTKINSQSLKDAEINYTKQNSVYVSIQENIYSPRCHMGEVIQQKHGDCIHSCDSYSPIEKSPLSKFSNLDKSLSRGDDSFCNSPKRIKTSIAGKKLNYFRVSTIMKIEENFQKNENFEKNEIFQKKSKFSNNNFKPRPSITSTLLNKNNKIDANLEYINVDHGILKKNTLKRTEKGFKYLRSLARKYKKPAKRRNSKFSTDFTFEGLKEILCIKDNIEIENLKKDKIEKERERERDSHHVNNINSSSRSIISLVEKKSPNLNIITINDIPSNFQSSSSNKIPSYPNIPPSTNNTNNLPNNLSRRRNTQILAPSLFIIPNEEEEKEEKSSRSNSCSSESSNTHTDSNSDSPSSMSDNSNSSVSSMRLSETENMEENENNELTSYDNLYNFPLSSNTTKSSSKLKISSRNVNKYNANDLKSQSKRDVKTGLCFNKPSSTSTSSKKLNNSFHHISKKDKEDFFIELYQC